MEESFDAERIEACDLKLEVDNSIPLRDYYDLATDLLHRADLRREDERVLEPYITLSRFSSLVLEIIPNHQDYMVMYSKQRNDLMKKAHVAKEELKLLKPEIKCQLDELNAGVLLKNREKEHIILPGDQVLTQIDIAKLTTSGECPQKWDGLNESVTSDHNIMDRQLPKLEGSEDECKLPPSPLVDSSFEKDPLLVNLEKISDANCQVTTAGPSMELNGESFPYLKQDNPVDHKYCAQLQLLTADISSLIQEIFGLIRSCQQSEKDAKEAACEVKRMERLYKKEVRQRKQSEQVLTDLLLKLENLRYQRDELLDDLRIIEDEKAKMATTISELEDKLKTSQYLVDLLLKERDDAIEERKLLHLKMVPTSSEMIADILGFSLLEIEQATSNFDNALKIGEGRDSCVYRGFIRNTSVAIKRFDMPCFEDKPKLHQELELLGRVRHPHFVSIIGYCPEASCLIYELLSNGSLEDILGRTKNSSPLCWPARFRIAAEVCSALIFLHSCNPLLIHGNLKPTNILLDANFKSKLSDLRSPQYIQFNSADTSDDSEELLAYMDPEYFHTYQLTTCSDVYSFGVIVLRLLTGLPAAVVVEVVTKALSEEALQPILDDSAGEWPFIQATQLAHLGLRCCERRPTDRPELESEVWRVLEPLARASSLDSPLFSPHLQGDDVPSYFMCPILQEVMREPHMASDGFTYEAEAIQAWLDGGHDTSPMTNMKLSNKQLIPNRALRSVIQEWMQKHKDGALINRP